MSPRYDVAIHAPRASPLYEDPPGPSPGGGEVQMRYLATTLARLGFSVCHVVYDDPALPARRDGVHLVRAPFPGDGGSRVAHARDVFASLAAADASVYIQRNAGSTTGMVAVFARSRRRRFVLSTSWDGDLALETPMGGRLARESYRVGRRLADAIVVQTEDQLHRARGLVDRPLHVIRSFAENSGDAGLERVAFLWIGRVVDYKDPLAYAELAARVPQARFWMVADASAPEPVQLAEELQVRVRELPNLELLEPLPREELLALYDRAAAVVNTSHVEGFPNTFMEGWARGAPALSLRLDPDGIISRHELGRFAAGSQAEFASAAHEIWESRHDSALGERAHAYIEREHSPPVIGERWARLLRELQAGERSR